MSSPRVRFITSRFTSFIEHESAKYFVIPQRYILSLLASLAVLIVMESKTCINVMIVENFIYMKENDMSNDTCPAVEGLSENVTPKETPILYFNWTMQTKVLIKDSYYWGFAVGILPGGFLADQFGGKYIVTVCMLLSSFCLIMLPGIIDIRNISDSVTESAVILENFLQGMFHGPVNLGIMTVLAHWVPSSQRTAIITFVYRIEVLGDQLGYVINNAFNNYSWRVGFYFAGGMGIVWCIFWHFLIYPTPWDNPFIKKNKGILLEEELDENIVVGWKRVPWIEIVFSKPIWALMILNCGASWGWRILIVTIEDYVKTVLKGEVIWRSFWWTTFFLYFGLAFFFGFTADWFLKSQHLSITTIKKNYAAIAVAGPAVGIIFIGFLRCNLDAIMAWYTAALCLSAVYYSSIVVSLLDMTSNYIGFLTGIQSAFSYIVFCVAPYVVTQETSENTLSEWSYFFYTIAFVQILSVLVFQIFGNNDKQPWNIVRK